MHKEQRFSPKYWVFHDKLSDDVFIDTAAKSLDASTKLAEKLHANSYQEFMNDSEGKRYQFVLVQLNFID